MKRLSLRLRFTLITSFVLLVCCLAIYFSVRSSALMQLDSIEAGMLDISTDSDTDISMSLSMADVFPEVTDIVAQTKADFTRQSILITLCVLLLGALATYFAGALILAPVRDLDRKVLETTEHELDRPLPLPEAKDEVRQLTESFNHMRSRLHQAFTVQKQFSANAAHELRTPLAVMQTSLEVFEKKENKTPEEYEALLGSTLDQLDRMNHLVDTLLAFQSMHTAALEEFLALGELTEEICCDLEPLAEEKGIRLIFDPASAESTGCVRCNEPLLYRAISNLIENAIKYNKPEGSVTLLVSDAPEAVLLRVMDTGIGIPEEEQNKIFDAFYRVDKSRSRAFGGAGLGLAMVSEIVTLHGGSVKIEKSGPEGTVMLMHLPAEKQTS